MRQALQSQRAQGWSNVVAASGSPSQIFEQGNQIISMAQARIQSDLQGIQQIAAGNPAAVNDRVCQSAQGAVVALQCDIMASKDLILATQGTLEIAGCLTGFKGSINNGPPTTGFPVSGPNGSSGATTSDLLRSLLSGPSPSAPLASQSKYQEFEDAIANSKVAGDSAGREQEDANISASRLARQDGSNAGLSSEIDSALASDGDHSTKPDKGVDGAVEQSASDSDWTDPLETGPQQRNLKSADSDISDVMTSSNATASVDNLSSQSSDYSRSSVNGGDSNNDLAKKNEELAADVLKEGISSTGELGETAVQTFDNIQGWKKLTSQDPDEQIDGATLVTGDFNKAFNTNPISAVVTDQLIGAVGSVAKQEFKILDTIDRASRYNDVTPSDINRELDALPQALGKGLIPGYERMETIQTDFATAQKTFQKNVSSGWQSIKNFITGKKECQPFEVFC